MHGQTSHCCRIRCSSKVKSSSQKSMLFSSKSFSCNMQSKFDEGSLFGIVNCFLYGSRFYVDFFQFFWLDKCTESPACSDTGYFDDTYVNGPFDDSNESYVDIFGITFEFKQPIKLISSNNSKFDWTRHVSFAFATLGCCCRWGKKRFKFFFWRFLLS